ncbi:PQQ-binding-like beta-propeller repeat protein [Ochrovirga pacifica]|uniref:hypothetical protein n=1 Tax=Ochrovirga pacifica TaxID=1042376 RepID=UPI00025583A8|nr:hypothetical protein [Ochrovirga pacifica]
MKLKLLVLSFLAFLSIVQASEKEKNNRRKKTMSIDTNYTIQKVQTANYKKQTVLIASSYEGTLLAYSDEGKLLWEQPLSGFMNHDLWSGDLDGDAIDEVVVANANGTIYCVNSFGEVMWSFQKNQAPMYAVTMVKKEDKTYVVAGGFDTSLYYLSAQGTLIKEIKTSRFSIEKPWSKNKKELPKAGIATANFIRPYQKSDGTNGLVVLGTNNHMNVPGTLYFFNPLEELPFKKVPVKGNKSLKKKIRIRPIGDFKIADVDQDGNDEIIMGASAHSNDLLVTTYDIDANRFSFHEIKKVRFGYDIAQTIVLNQRNKNYYITRIGNQIRLYQPSDNTLKEEIIQSKYAYYDVWKDEKNNQMIMASAQSGGSCIHVFDLNSEVWKKDYQQLEPKGKIATILENTQQIKKQLKAYQKPEVENSSQLVYLMTEKIPENLQKLKTEIETTYKNPVFLNSVFMKNVEKFDRSVLSNSKYQNTRDRRKKYTLTSIQAVSEIAENYKNAPGISYWGGHGNDPYMFSIATTKKVIDKARGKKTVLIYPEVEDHNESNLTFLLNDLIYPLANYAQGKNTNIFLRSKNIFWLGSNYLSPWSRLMSGEFADVFIPSMEETTDKTMELSLAGRMGMWTSGAVKSWGTRAVPDNVSFDRSRQLGNQRLPNHMLRMLIFHTANGAQFINNFPVNQEYISLYWELIAKGALYVPKRNEVLSISPVHLSMKEPDHRFLEDGANVKWTVFFNEKEEAENPMVFSRMNGSWPGAVITPWDFSRYASGVKERRLNFLAPYPNGLVLITPPQNGVFAQQNVPRGLLKDNLHSMYKNITKEFITDGRSYFSADGKTKYNAKEYYKVVEKEIQKYAKELPLTVSGEVAWVVAQIAPDKLRVTLLDNGYINPKKSTATIQFHKVVPVQIQDILSQEKFKSSQQRTSIEIPLGGFRFIDVTIKQAL